MVAQKRMPGTAKSFRPKRPNPCATITAMTSRFYSLHHKPRQQDRVVLPFPASYRDGLQSGASTRDWTLHLSGLKGDERILSFKDLLGLPQSKLEQRLVSSEGWSYKATWEGVLFSDLLQAHPPVEDARFLIQTNAAGHQESLPLDTTAYPFWLLCHSVNGVQLPDLYGGPIRLTVFNRFSYKGLPQITRLAFSPTDLETTFWETHGYDREGAITPGDYYAFDQAAFRPIRGPETSS